ncbi:uncharacterized protein HMPREF1541_07494 [Cyphellophora europaea CBS 101466]|uniref:Uncharacterized protein n=1 Tax=Cyphellophora europaea (strain CBS 101466) TaxID=1220924 RepID=W2RN14_CYPE1|nr:uncharacterized protein HMPREF1541_07494 [Cyphellophora europaea CBS 101466]ETN37871.1 hypothetical protein HMPREF1541_07494 [Cyphellophora europaea CBS 101466]
MWSRTVVATVALCLTSFTQHASASPKPQPQAAGGVQLYGGMPSSTASPASIPSVASSVVNGTSHLYSLTRLFFSTMMVPNNLPQLKTLQSPLFAENITGRVSDSRKFLGRELNTEYVFGAFTGPVMNSSRVTLLGMPIQHETMRFAANEADRSAFITEIVHFNISMLSTVVPVQVELWMRWNDQDELTAYDARFVYFDWLMATATANLQKAYGLGSAQDTLNQIKNLLVGQVCETTQQHCTGELQQYDSLDDCHSFLMQEIRLGQPFEFGVDTVMCRSLHEGMLTLKPEAHCPHVGKTGGNMCVDDLDYLTYVADRDFFGVPGAGW